MDGGILAEKLLGKTDIASLDFDGLRQFIKSIGEKDFRAKQIYGWIHKKNVTSFDDMTNLSKDLRETLKKSCIIESVKIAGMQEAKDGTRKFLMQLCDGNMVESVLMKYRHGNSICISTQAGCRMGCRFCASTAGGLERSLMPSEMLGQVYRVQSATGRRISNVILMGIGEPLDNYSNVVKFIKMLSGKDGFNLSQRNITLSTCGLADKLRRLADEGLTITVAISLHAPDDQLRQKIMPVAKAYPIQEIIETCRYYIEKTGRRITFEYSLMEGVNDSSTHAEQLSRLLKGINCHVNLIPLNPVDGRMGRRPAREQVQRFKLMLEKNHINVTIRREMGSGIDAACGQLRNKNKGGRLYEGIRKN